jgi:DNA-binding NarL/FixJ family response regulator
MIRIGVADDQQLIRDGIRLVLQLTDDLEVVGEATNGAEAVEMAARHQPDVILMDIRMPIVDGIAATKRIVASHPSCRVLILTTYDRDELVYEAMRSGASGFLLKDVGHELLTTGIRSAARGDALVAPSVTRRLIEDFARRPGPVQARRALEPLTEREREVLTLVARGLTNAEVAATLQVAEQTVKTHVGRVLAKLGLRDRVQAVVFAYEVGLLRPGEHR